MALPHVTVCICTFKRPDLLLRALKEIVGQETGGLFTFSVVVTDNDSAESARSAVAGFAAGSPVRVVYAPEPRQNIALARNQALRNAPGDFIAFIDDDEFPVPSWLLSHFRSLAEHGADGVLGPVNPHFGDTPPPWAVKGRFFERPTHATGFVIPLAEARTGNVLFRRSILEGSDEPFHPQFGTGGEDVDFFRRMMGQGRRFVWCQEGAVFETVPPSRCTRKYLLRRALLRGRNTIRHSAGRGRKIVTSLLAVPLYTLLLPFLLLGGEHRFLKYLIKLCDHSGRLLAVVGLNPVHERDV